MSSCVVVDLVVLGLGLVVGLGLSGRLLPGRVTIAGALTLGLVVVVVVDVVLVVVLVVVVLDFSFGFNCCLKSSRFLRKSSISTVLTVDVSLDVV